MFLPPSMSLMQVGRGVMQFHLFHENQTIPVDKKTTFSTSLYATHKDNHHGLITMVFLPPSLSLMVG